MQEKRSIYPLKNGVRYTGDQKCYKDLDAVGFGHPVYLEFADTGKALTTIRVLESRIVSEKIL